MLRHISPNSEARVYVFAYNTPLNRIIKMCRNNNIAHFEYKNNIIINSKKTDGFIRMKVDVDVKICFFVYIYFL